MTTQKPQPGPATKREAQLEKRLAAALKQLRYTRVALDQARNHVVAEDILAMVNHQFRSPLSTLGNAVNLLRDSMLSSEQLEWVLVAEAAIRSLTYQVNQLGELGRLGKPADELEISEVAVADLLDEVLDLYSTQARAERTTIFGTVTRPAACRVSVDVGRVRQIVINLLSIGLIHARRGTVDVHCTLDGGALRFTLVARPGPEASAASEDRDTLHHLTYLILERQAGVVGGSFKSLSSDPALQLQVSVPVQPTRQPRDRYVESLVAALKDARVVVVGARPIQQRILALLRTWGVAMRQLDAASAVRAVTEREVVVGSVDELPTLRRLARAGIEAIAVSEQDAALVPNSDVGSLKIERLPVTWREVLEWVGQPELRRYEARLQASMLPAGQNPVYILLAEDSLANRMVQVRMLERLGHRVHAVSDGREAVYAASQFEFDLILMDILMPNMDGMEAARAILTAVRATEAPPIVALTARSDAKQRQACVDAGMCAFLSKPVAVESLVDVVTKWGREGQMRRTRRTSGRHSRLPILDRGAMIRLRKELDGSLIPEMGAMFLVELDAKVADAQGKAEAEQWGLIPKILEPIMSGASSFGARQLGALVEEVQSAIRAGDNDLAAYYLGELPEVAKLTSSTLRAQFKE